MELMDEEASEFIERKLNENLSDDE